ncbi:DUF3775 domain-containing protein [Legionella hackeliae]|uniref:DUF3775 domain-containing protein n=1 Tax=Legionella hackeliae TaxID=449 RepID=A0A0A8UYH0_LEGHA|nr:DUF3775 domain-containing protein [Legionella hackeliae]KTD12726.1 hypothetical protein Lhac_1597 [Legionella hackeliae]CEK12147.1 conserved protein of unknown function [Legionella hackeliae]STX48934.1 Protein of uncharacterised function (DUF3775) [Legionella hackeliae]
MLNIEPHKIRDILNQIKCFQEKEDEYPKLTCEKDSLYVLSDPWYQSVLNKINTLPPDQQATLVALLYLGHGDFKKSEWTEAFAIAHDQLTNHIGQYLLSQPKVINYIENGLKILGFTN